MLRLISLTVLALLLWVTLLMAGTIEGWWRKPLATPGDTRAFLSAAIARIDREHKGNVAFALLERGRSTGTHFKSAGKPVGASTRFQVASLSKWITAWGVLTLVDAGKLDLDAPVSRYLTRWKLPVGKFDNKAVTVRRLLSHTAGLGDGLGYAGFKPGEALQPIEESLTRAADASPGASGIVRVETEPGTSFKYSGGGYTLLQLLIEEISGQAFAAYMKSAVFDPLQMNGSTFALEPDAENVAEFFDERGAPATHYRFTAVAAASLYTTTADLTRFLAAQTQGASGEPAGRGVLRPETLRQMRRPHAAQFGVDIWGLGVILYAPNGSGDFVIGHDGSNAPAINTAARLDPASGDGIIVLESGNRLLATEIAGEWVFWRTGNVDLLTVLAEFGTTLKVAAAGALVIVILATVNGWRMRRSK
jgi:CubicO group peptidase (beta-lactamase class C family)